MTNVYNRREQTPLRQDLRNNASPIERLLWGRLRGSQIAGAKFRRQFGIGEFIVDFYCPAIKLAVELDGESHRTDEATVKDRRRSAYVESLGVTVLRFSNEQIVNEMDVVVEQIAHVAASLPKAAGAKQKAEPHPNPPLAKGRE